MLFDNTKKEIAPMDHATVHFKGNYQFRKIGHKISRRGNLCDSL